MVSVRDVQDVYRAASMYYLQNQTMEVIGATLGVSRSTVSRLLTAARESGLVQITVHSPAEVGRGIGQELSTIFGIRVHVVSVRQRSMDRQRLEQVAAVAGNYIAEWFSEGMTLGVAWGTTVAAIVNHIPARPILDSAVVQLNGSASTEISGITYGTALIGDIAHRFDSVPYFFPVPAFFDYEETKQMMWRERAIQGVLSLQRETDIALFGVGGIEATIPSHVYSAGYLNDEDMAELRRQKVVGDVCTVLLREDGSYRDISLNARASGPTPEELQRISRRVCVVVGEAKAPAIIGAMRAGVATDLIIDEITARSVLARLRSY